MKSAPNLAALHRRALAAGATVQVGGASFNAGGQQAVVAAPRPAPPAEPGPDPMQELARAITMQAAVMHETLRDGMAQVAEAIARPAPAPTPVAVPAPRAPMAYVFDVERRPDGLIERVVARPVSASET